MQDIYNKFIASNSNISSSGDIYLNWKYSNETIKQAHDDWKHLTYLPNPNAKAIAVSEDAFIVIRAINTSLLTAIAFAFGLGKYAKCFQSS